MALRNIVLEGDEILRKRAKDVTVFGERLHELLDDMWETMEQAGGVGLAAPQVGMLRRIVVIDVTPPQDEDGDAAPPVDETAVTRVELVNPVIMHSEGESCESEGCLSVPGVVGTVCRPAVVRVKALDRNGDEFELTGDGYLAKAICHEIDHLEGVLFIDIAEDLEETDS
jgi:peptide deformylase